MVIRALNPSTQVAKSGGMGVQGHPWLHSKY